MEKIQQLAKELRTLICQYRISKNNTDISTHVSAIEIALGLVEMGIEDKRAVREQEENWFKAGYHLSYIFPSGSEWETISILYDRMVDIVQELNYFR